jgi:polyhydroxybutyrate depolymerase
VKLVRFAATAAVIVALAGLFFWARYLRMTAPPEPELSAQIQRGVLSAGGRERTFLFYAPAKTAPQPALVVAFHGSMGDGAQARKAFGFELDALADARGFVVVYPDGFEGHWNDCRTHAPFSANTQNVDDMSFVRGLVDRFAKTHGVDRTRVFATGISNGGHMALRLALEAPELVRAVAPVIASLPAADNTDCTAHDAPVSILVMNGTADPYNPYGGGEVILHGVWGSRGDVISTDATLSYWAKLAGYGAPTSVESLADRDAADASTVEVTRWVAPGKKSLALYAIRGGGHTVPHPVARMPRILGATNADIVAAREIASFFEAAP